MICFYDFFLSMYKSNLPRQFEHSNSLENVVVVVVQNFSEMSMNSARMRGDASCRALAPSPVSSSITPTVSI